MLVLYVCLNLYLCFRLSFSNSSRHMTWTACASQISPPPKQSTRPHKAIPLVNTFTKIYSKFRQSTRSLLGGKIGYHWHEPLTIVIFKDNNVLNFCQSGLLGYRSAELDFCLTVLSYLEIKGFFRIKVFIHEIACCCCSSSSGGVMLVHKRNVGLLAVNMERRGLVKFKWTFID